MRKTPRRQTGDVRVRHTKATRAKTNAPAPEASAAAARAEPETASWVEDAAFAVFVGYLVLAFTMAFPYQFALPKLLGLDVYVVFSAASWGLALRRGRVRALPRALTLTTAALALWWIATTLAAQHLPTAIFGLRGRYNGLATMLAGLALFVFLASTRLTSRQIERRLGAIGVALTLASAYGLVQAAGVDPIPWPEGRPASTIGHPVIFAGALALELPFVAAFALGARSRLARVAWGGMALVQALALTMTLARGPWVAAACGLLVLGALTLSRQRALAPRLAALAVGALAVVSGIVAVSPTSRELVLGRLSTVAHLAGDESVGYRLHFYRAALAMLRDHPVVGVGWENFGLLYPRYQSAPALSGDSDLVPTMVHSGPLQTAVSGGILAWVLQVLFLAGVGAAVIRRRREEEAVRQRLLGAAFLASLVAYFVQDLSGWPHVALETLALVVWGLGVAWSQEPRPGVATRNHWALVALASAAGIGAAWQSFDTWQRIRAETLMFDAQRLDVRDEWPAIEQRVRKALDVSPDRAWASDAAAKLYEQRAAAATDRSAYERGVELTKAARAANPFDPYLRLRRVELDRIAMSHGLIARISEEGSEALRAAKAMTPGSALIEKLETSVTRWAGNSRIVSIEPQASAGFGPTGSLIVAGLAPRALHGTHVTLHWRNVTRASEWTTQPDAPMPDARGAWYNAIPDAQLGERYEVYATCETQAQGPCTYAGNGSITACSPIAFIDPDTTGVAPPGSLLVAGKVLDAWAEKPVFLHWRNLTRQSAWTVRPFRSAEAGARVVFPPAIPGAWYSILSSIDLAERYQVYVSAPPTVYEPCTYGGDATRKFCAPVAWIQPQAMAGFGPPGSLVVAGASHEVWADLPVFLHWRNPARGAAWTTEAYAPTPDRHGTWYNFIPHADPSQRYEVLVTSPTTASETCTYAGDGYRTVCP